MLVLILLAGKSDVWDQDLVIPCVNPDHSLFKKITLNLKISRQDILRINFRGEF